MTSNNPYESASTPQVESSQPSLVKSRDILGVFTCSVFGGLIGLGLGAALGYFLPSYYRSVFANGDSATFDPLSVGIGQGLTQGIALGACIGVAILLGNYWFEIQKRKIEQKNAS